MAMWRIRYLISTLRDDEGIGVVEIILILVVLIGLVIIFKSQAYQSGADNFRKDYQRKRGNLKRSDARKLKGEITVFLSLIFILLVSFAGA